VDLVGAGVLFALAISAPNRPHEQPTEPYSPVVIALLAVVYGVLAVRRKWPLVALAVTTLGVVPAVALGVGIEPFLVPVVVAAYTVAVRTDRWTAWTTAVPAVLFLVMAVVLFTPTPGFTLEGVGRFAWIGMAVAVGDAIRSRRGYIAAIQERAERAERTREEEALRRVAEERLHIARELHDVVAHHIAVINVQAGVAEHLVTTDPQAAAEALTHVRRSSRAVLDELGGLLGVLRRPDESATPTEPAPGLAQLEGLVETLRASGVELRWSLSGQPAELPPTVDLVAYRVVQEALTNAHRHGTDAATLSIVYGASEVVIDVANAVGPRRDTGGTGLGLVGMRERAATVGGTFRAGVDADEKFRVHVTLPLQLGMSA
jgi:signal transduction histidine kinase